MPEPPAERIVEGEILGNPAPAPWWKRLMARGAAALALGSLGLLLLCAGVVLTLSLVGAPLGVPLAFAGLLCLLLALVAAFGRVKVVTSSRPGERPPWS